MGASGDFVGTKFGAEWYCMGAGGTVWELCGDQFLSRIPIKKFNYWPPTIVLAKNEQLHRFSRAKVSGFSA